MKILFFALAYLSLSLTTVFAGEANVLKVEFEKTGDGYLTVSVTVQHDDEGWEHYADRWEILDMEGNLLDQRILRHPHSAAPFSRSLPRAKLPKGIKKIRVRAHDNVHDYGGKEMTVLVPEI